MDTDTQESSNATQGNNNNTEEGDDQSCHRTGSDNGEDDEGYATDFTSSYDSTDDNAWYSSMSSNMMVDMVYGNKKRALRQPASMASGFGRRENGSDKHQKLDNLKVGHKLDNGHEVVDELFQATKNFYSPPIGDAVPGKASLSPLLEEGLQDNEEQAPNADHSETGAAAVSVESSSDDSSNLIRPFSAPHRPVNDVRNNQLLHVVQSQSSTNSSTITFREALTPSDKPRLVTLSFPPFIVVHVNQAYSNLTGYMSNDVLGSPLHTVLGAQFEEKTMPPVMALDGKVIPIEVEEEGTHQEQLMHRKCAVKISMIGPETWVMPTNNQQREGGISANKSEDDSNTVVTHYGVELVPTESDSELDEEVGFRLRRALVSPESPCFRGVLG